MDKKSVVRGQAAPVSQAISFPKTQGERSPYSDSAKPPHRHDPFSSESPDPSVNSNHLASSPGNWRVVIHTLGRFAALSDERPVELAKKPLTLLKVLIARNGRDVPEEDIAGRVWPDSEGDVALQNFATTLHRLRKLFGNNSVILSRNGCVSLNASNCIVDIWTFQRLVGLADSINTRGNIESKHKIELLENAVQVYRGAFLEADREGLACSLPMRERLRSKFTRCVTELSEHYEQQGLYRQAIQIYERSLEIDDAAEEFYRRLMICHFRRGQRSAVYAVYQRYRKVLKETTGLEPDREMQNLYERLIDRNTAKVKTDA